MNKDVLSRVGRVLETGGLSLIFERGEQPPVQPERNAPIAKREEVVEILSTGGYSLIDRHIEVEQITSEPGTESISDYSE